MGRRPARSYTGGIYDAADGTWSDLPPPVDVPLFSHDIAGVIGPATASYQYDSGWALDLDARRWTEIAQLYAREGVADGSVTALGTHTAVGRYLFACGGLRWDSADDPTGSPIGEAWLWTPPSLARG